MTAPHSPRSPHSSPPPGAPRPSLDGLDGPGLGAPSPAERRRRAVRAQAPVVVAVSLGGGVGAVARYAASLLWPTVPGAFPLTTLCVNVLGCAVMGVLMVIITEVRAAHRLVRPFLGTGVLGGFTTFSTYAVDTQRLVTVGEAGTALLYLAATVSAALSAVWLAATATRRLFVRRGKEV